MPCFGLIGKKLGHSFSKSWFEQQFMHLGISDCSYENVEIDAISDVLNATNHLTGFNVTIPYKTQILSYIDELSVEAAQINAVNCVVRKDGKLIGHNTDWFGFSESLTPLLRDNVDYKALVLGASGGAAQAVKFALAKLNIKSLDISRTKLESNLTYSELTPEIVSECKLIINCTPLGMWPDVDNCPKVPFKTISSEHILYDLVYNPVETQFLHHGRLCGATIKNGLEMLHLQAQKSWDIFFSLK